MKIREVSIILLVAWVPSPALADTDGERTAQAEALFQEAVTLVDGGRAPEACPKFEESERLAAGIGTEFRLADCYEKIGRTASAWAGFSDLAGRVKSSEQIEKARSRAIALEPKLCRLRLVVPASLAALEGIRIERDGVEVGKAAWGSPAPVDPGRHAVRATANGHRSWQMTVEVVQPGATVQVQVPELQRTSASTPFIRPQRIAALVMGGVGLAGIGIGTGLGVVAGSKWSDAQDRCPAKVDCDAEAHRLSVDALSFAHGSTAAFVVGGAAVAGAAILWFTAPPAEARASAALRFSPTVGPGSLGTTLQGSF